MALKLDTDSIEYQYLRDVKGDDEIEKRQKFLSEGEDNEDEEDEPEDD